MDNRKRVFIIEDSRLIRDRLTATIEAINGYAVVGYAESETEAIKLIDSLCPDLVVADIQLKQGSGLRVLRHVREHSYLPRPIVVMLTNYASTEYYDRSLAAGADAVFDKTSQYDEFLDFLEQGRAG